jgi:hypothetical protein
MDLQYKIVYKKGCTNNAVDALSRCLALHPVCAMSACTPAWIENLIEGYKEDSQAVQLLTELAFTSPNQAGYSLEECIIRFRGRVWIGNNLLAQQHVIQALHSSGVGGHSGFHGTYHRIKALFSWPKMKESIRQYVMECTICQQAKVEHVKTPSLLEPLPVPVQPWTTVSLDFIEGLPSSNKCDVIMVVIDKFIKYRHFIPLSHPFTASQVAQVYLNNIYKLYGLPQQMISDRDKIFTSAV